MLYLLGKDIAANRRILIQLEWIESVAEVGPETVEVVTFSGSHYMLGPEIGQVDMNPGAAEFVQQALDHLRS